MSFDTDTFLMLSLSNSSVDVWLTYLLVNSLNLAKQKNIALVLYIETRTLTGLIDRLS